MLKKLLLIILLVIVAVFIYQGNCRKKNIILKNKTILNDSEYIELDSLTQTQLLIELQKQMNVHNFRNFENILIENNLAYWDSIHCSAYLKLNEFVIPQIRFLVLRYYVLFAYDDNLWTMPIYGIMNYKKKLLVEESYIEMYYKMKRTQYLVVEHGVEEWQNITQYKENNQEDFLIDYIYYITKSNICKDTFPEVLFNNRFNTNDLDYLSSKITNKKNSSDYLLLICKCLSYANDTLNYKKYSDIYKSKCKNYYNIMLTQRFRYDIFDLRFNYMGEREGKRMRLLNKIIAFSKVPINRDEIEKIKQHGNFEDVKIAQLMSLSLLTFNNKNDSVILVSDSLLKDISSIDVVGDFMINIRNAILFYKSIALFKKSDLSIFGEFINKEKYEYKYYFIGEYDGFKFFLFKLYKNYYKGNLTFNEVYNICSKKIDLNPNTPD